MLEPADWDTPSVSVIMPIRNEARFIAESLGAVLRQDYPSERLEVLVADGMSTDDTRAIIEEVSASRPEVKVMVLDNPKHIVPSGLNTALGQARGEIIVRVDGHTIVADDYVSACVDALQRTGADNVGGRMDPVGGDGLAGAIALATSHPFGIGGGRFHFSDREEWVDTVYMGAWHRQVFDRVGLFDEEFVRNQDDEHNYRLRARGGKILLSPDIRSRYHNRDSITALWKQYFKYGYWKVRVMQKHPRQMRLRQFVPPVFVLSLGIGAMLGLASSMARRVWFGIVITYVVANSAASLARLRQMKWPQLPLLSLAFVTMHVSYGLGFLGGLVRFHNRWIYR